ncbi:MAG: hypothetical protein K2Y56_17860 [Methylobacterium sp.]|uniref:hypothetical protein n=1 Tax=Methylobacterium sp. TaxID=409 RepID=UPI0025E93289|nr:hypothetical protein [Methylobacterium sp.]MBX9933373.1 hypothetical protein [Methylobacterium sp.]
MRRRFTVIEGGAAASMALREAWEAARTDEPATWRIDLVRPCDVTEDRANAWRSLLTRLRSHDPVFADPDYLVPAAQHQARGDDLVFAFAVAEGQHERLEGVIGLATSRGFWGRTRTGFWKPAGVTLASAINPDHSGAIREALGASLKRTGLNVPGEFENPAELRAVVSSESGPGEIGSRPRPSAYAVLAPERDIPLRNLLAVRPGTKMPTEPTRVTRVLEPDMIRDAVEEFLSIDARVSRCPIVADPSEAALVRVVTRLFARRRQATVEIVRRADRIVGARLRLGHGPNAVLWKQAYERETQGVDATPSGRIAG